MTGKELISFIIKNRLENYKFVRYEHGDIYDIYPDIDDENHRVLIYFVDFL